LAGIGKIGRHLTADEAKNVTRLMEQELQTSGREAFKPWRLQFACHNDVIVIDGKTYRFKMVSAKAFLTKFGEITVPRRIFHQDNGGKTYVPLDVVWEMDGDSKHRHRNGQTTCPTRRRFARRRSLARRVACRRHEGVCDAFGRCQHSTQHTWQEERSSDGTPARGRCNVA
jgi:hypothetical protein